MAAVVLLWRRGFDWTDLALLLAIAGAHYRKALPPGLWIYGHFGDLRGWLTGREPNLNSAAVALSRLEHHYSYARAASELDYRPRGAREAAEKVSR